MTIEKHIATMYENLHKLVIHDSLLGEVEFTDYFDEKEVNQIGAFFEDYIINAPNQFLTKVEEFHKVFGHPIAEAPFILTKERAKLRVGLIQEELNELALAYTEENMVEVADALADIMYVVCGAILETGLKDKFIPIFNEVHKSNMSKSCASLKEAELSVSTINLEKLDSIYSFTEEREGRFVIKRKSDDKILKSINWQKPNIKDLL